MKDINYNIDNELMIRKWIDLFLDYTIEIHKGGKYEYDLDIFRYNTDSSEKLCIGHIEIEVCQNKSWDSPIFPKNWVYSFLARKVFLFDKRNNEFTSKLKEKKSSRTIYLKFNYNFTDCFCQTVPIISKYPFKENLGFDCFDRKRNDCYLRTKRKNVVHGLNECKEFIKDFFERQRLLDEFDYGRVGCALSKRTA